MHDPDPRTLQRARAGDLPAFEELVRGYQAEVFRFALHLTHDHPLAEDVTQETFLRAFRFIRGYRGAQRFGSWLFAIARNCSMDALRKRGRIAASPEHEARTTPDASVRAELDAALAASPPTIARRSCSSRCGACRTRRPPTSWGSRSAP